MLAVEFAARLDEELRTDAYADVDASLNGLQIGPGEVDVDHVAFAVDASQATAEAAIEAGADLLVTHHGYAWGGFDRLTGRVYDRIAPHVREELPLYVSHLPLDGHQELGNAARLADMLDLSNRAPFGEMGPEYVGQRGSARDAYTVAELAEVLEAELERDDDEHVQTLDFGPEEIEDVAIVTGSGVDWLGEAVAKGVDALVTGEGKQKVYHEARESGITVFLAGHYATETFGVRALADHITDWGLDTTYIEHPTGL